MTDDEVRRFVDALRAKGVVFERTADKWRVPRRLLTAHEVETLFEYADTVHRVLSAPASEQENEEPPETVAAGGQTLVSLPAPPAAASQPVAAEPTQSRDTGHAGTVPDPPGRPPIPAEAPASELSWEKRVAAGLFRMNGIWTHSKGDGYAQAVISGRIPFDVALAQERRTERMHADMEHSRRLPAFDIDAIFTGGHR